jgi:hypothetical protein
MIKVLHLDAELQPTNPEEAVILKLYAGDGTIGFAPGPGALASRHYGPGEHPGTGTEQEVHAGGQALYGGNLRPMSAADRSALKDEGWTELGDWTPHEWPYPGMYPVRDPETGELSLLEGKQAILDYFARLTMDEKIEHGLLVDADGSLIFRAEGSEMNISFERDQAAFMKRALSERAFLAGRRLSFTHNHPGETETALSIDDIGAAFQNGFSEIRAVGMDGSFMVLEISQPDHVQRMTESLMYELQTLQGRHPNYNEFHDAIDEIRAERRSVGSGGKISLGDLPRELVTMYNGTIIDSLEKLQGAHQGLFDFRRGRLER